MILMVLRRWLASAVSHLGGRQVESELDEEIRVHLEMAVDEHVARGMTRSAALRAARLSFGVVASVKEARWQADSLYWLDTTLQDIRFGVRMLIRSPGFAGTAVLTLALGVGMTTAVFSVVDNLLLNGVPFAQSDRLVELHTWGPTGGGPYQSPSMLAPWRSQTELFERVEAYQNVRRTLREGDEPEALDGARLSPAMLDFLGVQPRAGRSFASDEGTARVALLSDQLWRSRFDGDDDVIGRPLRLDDEIFTIVGVMPASFRFPDSRAQFWVPLDPRPGPPPAPGRRPSNIALVARLQPGVSFDQGDERAAALAPQLNPDLFDNGTTSRLQGTTTRLQPLNRFNVRGISAGFAYLQDRRAGLFLLFGAVAFVLLIACANAANLFLSRTLARQREFGIRAAAGAGRFRLLRQLLTEGVIISLLAGLLGLAFAIWILGFVNATIPPMLAVEMLNPIDLDWRVVSCALLAALTSGMLAAMVPAWRTVSGDLIGPLKGRGTGPLGGQGRLRGGLIAVQSALTVVLLIGGLLMGRSLWARTNVDLGWTPDRAVVLEPDFRGTRYQTSASRLDFLTRLSELAGQTAGVRVATPTDEVPFLAGAMTFGALETADASLPDQIVSFKQVTDGYFEALDIPIREGRTFAPEDQSQDIAIVSADIARRLWPDDTAVGQRLRMDDGVWLRVVGVAGAVQSDAYTAQYDDPQEIYLPLPSPNAATWQRPRYVVASTDGRDGLVALLKQQLWQLDPAMPVTVHVMDAVVRTSLSEPRFQTTLLASFAVLAILLAGAGVHAVVAHETNQRTQELGVRVALGASRRDVFRHAVGRSMLLSLAGVGAGLLVSLGLTRLLSSFLYEISPTDPLTFATAAGFLLAAAAAGGYRPARRAARIDPMVALRAD